MAYFLPRAMIVLIGWGTTCGLVATLWPDADPAIFLAAGVSWAFAGIACFGYLRRLRRELEIDRDRALTARQGSR